ncbi:plasmodesmata-located protein 6-like [Zingiber officinale]|uniref:plasmodesmata-located protein 6-like n=1 Tax=Zingiber officinale TaxID=94328 RepID=UPI001C4C6520|nr:plasmodesmata-located protein 6-like [Zingiber officinale]
MNNLFFFFLLLLAASIASPTAADDSANAYIYAGCSETRYAPGSPSQINVDSLLSSLVSASSSTPYSNLTSTAASASFPSFGLFQCRGDLQPSNCADCVRSAVSSISSLCPFAAGAAVQLAGCFLRYGNDSFVGEPDTSVLYKKCGAAGGGGYGPDQIGIRDAALSALTGGGGNGGAGGYRVGAAGYVQAVAQCVGDQSASECDDCVAAAVGQLRAACGYAVSGDAYLGKCYARFWYTGNGAYNDDADHHHDDPDHHHDDDDDDETGKTAAIVIGLIAGVALLIMFLTFLRKAGNYGKD